MKKANKILLIVLLLTLSASIFGRPIDFVRLNNSAKCTSNFRISKPINPFGKIGIQKAYSACNFVIKLPFFEKIIKESRRCSNKNDIVSLPLLGTIQSNVTSVCLNGTSPTITFTGINGIAPYSFVYKINNGADITCQSTGSSDTTTITLPTSTSGVFVYQLISVTDSSIPAVTQPQNGNVAISVNQLPTISGVLSTCVGSTSSLISNSPATTSPWVSSNISVATIDSSGLVEGISSGTTTITFTDSNGCQESGTTFTVNALPSIIGNDNVCIGFTSQLVGSNGASIISPWVSSNTSIATISNSGLVMGVSSGSTTITYTDSNSCTKNLANFTVNALPSVSGTLSTCIGSTSQLFGSGSPLTTSLAWVSSNTAIATVDSNGLVTGVSQGNVIISYTDSNGCTNSNTTFTVYGFPTISGNLTTCLNASSPTSLNGSGTKAASFPWISSNPSVATINNNGFVTPISAGTTTITYTNNRGCQEQVVFTVNPLPEIDYSYINNQCSGSTVQFTPSNTGFSSYSWNFNDSSTSNLTSPSHQFNVTNSGSASQTFNVSLTISNSSTGCSNTVYHNVVINNVPDSSISTSSVYGFDSIKNIFLNCEATISSPNYIFTAENTSTTSSINTSYTINWGDSSPTQNINSFTTPITHTYTSLGLFTITLNTYNSNTGCSSTKTYSLFNGNTPAGNLGNAGNTNDCVPFTLTWPVQNIQSNPNGTQYEIDFGDGSIALYDSTNLPTSISHEYLTSSCSATSNKFFVKFKAINPCDSSETTSQVTATLKPTAKYKINGDSDSLNPTACLNSEVVFENNSVGSYVLGSTNCSTTFNKTWTITPNTGWTLTNGVLNGTDIIKVVFNTVGTYSIRLNIRKPGASATRCTDDTIERMLCIEAISIAPQFSINSLEGCTPLAITTNNSTNSSAFCTTPKYLWEVTYSAGYCGSGTPNWSFTNGTNQNSASPTFSFVTPGTYILSLKATNACGTQTTTKTIIVKHPPTAVISPILNFCITSSITPTATIVACTTNPSSLSYAWDFSGGTPSSSTSALAPSISYTNPGNYAFSLTVTNDCGATTTTSNTFVINPLGQVDQPVSQKLCNGSTSTAVVFSTTNTAGTTTYSWTNSATSIGLSATGTGNIPAFTATNITSAPVIASITVTPTYTFGGISCAGPTKTFTITVNPTAQVNLVSSQIKCKGQSTSAIVFSTSNTVGTTSYSWTNTATSIGLPASGTGDIGSFVTTNTTTLPIIATISVTPTFTYNGYSCSGSNITFTITVNPLGQVNSVSNQVVCIGSSTSAINFNSNNTVGTTAYSWINSASSIGLASSGVGNIASFVTTNTTSTPIIAIITTTPTFTYSGVGCAGTNSIFTIQVNPKPVIPVQTATICSGTAFTTTPVNASPTTATIVPSGTTYTWTVALNANVTGESNQAIPQSSISQTLTNTTNTLQTVVYTVTPSFNGCPGATFTVTVTVNPTPYVSAQTAVACSGSGFTVSPVNATTSNIVPTGTTYSWSIPTVTGGITGGAAGTSQSTIFGTLTNPTNTVQTATYTVTPATASCTGATFTVTVTINPKPVIPNQTATICSGASFTTTLTDATPTTATIVPSATTYTWALPVVTGGITGGAAGTSQSTIFGTLTNPTNTVQTATYTVTPTSGATGACVGATFTVIATVNPKPVIPNQIAAICSGTAFTTTPVNASPTTATIVPSGTTYTWTVALNANVTGESDQATAQTSITQTLTNTTNTVQTVVYTVTPTSGASGACPGATFTVTVTVNPKPTIANETTAVCSTNLFTVTPTTGGVNNNIIAAGTTYTWAAPVVTGGITGGLLGTAQASITGTLTNPTNTPQTATYTVTPTSGTCAGATFTVVVTLNPKPVIPNQTATICSGLAFTTTPVNASPTVATIVPASTTYTWTVVDNTSVTGDSNQATAQSSISQTLTNITNTVQTVVYTVTPTSGAQGSCPGATFTVTVTVNPTVQVTQPVDQVVCNADTVSNVLDWVITPPLDSPSTYRLAVGLRKLRSAYLGNAIRLRRSTDNVEADFGFTGNNLDIVSITSWLGAATGYCVKLYDQSGVGNDMIPSTVAAQPTYVANGLNGKPVLHFSTTQNIKNATNFLAPFTALVTAKQTPGGTKQRVLTSITNNWLLGWWGAAKGQAHYDGWVSTAGGTASDNNPYVYTGTSTGSTSTVYENGISKTVTPTGGLTGPNGISINNTEPSDVDVAEIIIFNSVLSPTVRQELENNSGMYYNIFSTTYSSNWTNSNTSIGLLASGTGNINFTATNSTSAPLVATIVVTPTFTNGPSICTGSPKTYTITVNPTGQVTQPVNQVVCNNDATTVVAFATTNTIGTTTYTWTNNATSIGLAGSGTGDIPSFTAVNTTTAPIVATIVVTPIFTNGGKSCSGTTKTFTITVNPTGQVTQPVNQVVCNSVATTAITFATTNTLGTTTYAWTNSNTTIGLAGSGTGNIASFVAVNTTTAPIVATIVVTPTFTNGSKSCAGPTKTFTITVNPIHYIALNSDISTKNQTICSNSSITNIQYTISGGATNVNVVGLPSGVLYNLSGNIVTISGTPTVSGTYSYSITTTGNSCTAANTTGTITINSISAGSIGTSQTLCSGGDPVAFTSVAGVGITGAVISYQWQSSIDNNSYNNISGAIGLTYDTPSGLTTTTYYRRVITATINSFSCSANSNTVVVTITSIPAVPNVSGITPICEGSTTNLTVSGLAPSGQAFAGDGGARYINVSQTLPLTNFTYEMWVKTAAPSGGILNLHDGGSSFDRCLYIMGGQLYVYIWNGGAWNTNYTINDNKWHHIALTVQSGIGQKVYVDGNLVATYIYDHSDFNWQTNFTIGYSATNISYFNGQIDNVRVWNTVRTQADITNNKNLNAPASTVGLISNYLFEGNAQITTAGINGTPTNVVYTLANYYTYTWTGANSPVPSTLQTQTTGALSASGNYTVSATAGGCSGTSSGPVAISVVPKGQVDTPVSQVICHGSNTNAISFTTTNTLGTTAYNWTNNTTSIGLAASGSGNIASFIASNTGNAPIVATITVTPTYTYSGISCIGTPVTFTITVNPKPTVSQPVNKVYCSGEATTLIAFSGSTVTGTTYSWVNDNTSIGLIASGSGNILSFTTTNATNISQVATIIVTPNYSNGGQNCPGISKTFTITVNPKPVIPNQDVTICTGTPITINPTNIGTTIVPVGTTYTWSILTNNSNISGQTSSVTAQNAITQTLTNSSSTAQSIQYTVIPKYGTCVGSSFVLTITVKDQTVIPAILESVCSGQSFNVLPSSGIPAGTTYTWGSPIVTSGISGATIGTTQNSISGNLINSSNSPQTATYTITPVLSSSSTCQIQPFSVIVTVNPFPSIVNQSINICSESSFSSTFNSSTNIIPAGTTFTWTILNNNVNISGQTVALAVESSFNQTLVNTTNNPEIITYTVTPLFNSCTGTSFTVSITVNPKTTPSFTQVSSICSGASLSALPTTSNNGITGTWSPALDNTATTTYTFTPTMGQCATTELMTITVTPNTTPTFTQVATICSGVSLSALPTTSNNGITGTWSPALDNTATTTYTFTPTTGQCSTIANMTISVTPKPTPAFTQVAAICSGASLSALPTTSNNGITGTWSPAIDNTATTTYTFTPTTGQCATIANMTISVGSSTLPTFTQVAAICSGASLSALPTTSNNGITGTWSPGINNTATTTYVFTPIAGQCAIVANMTISVTPNTTPTFTQVAAICSGATLAALPTTSTNGITGTWSPAVNNATTTTYIFTPIAGQCATTTFMTISVTQQPIPIFTQVPAICSGWVLSALPTTSNNGITGTWLPAINNTATTTYIFTPTTGQCAATSSMTITVTPNSVPSFTQVSSICSGASLPALPTTSNNRIIGTWSPAINNTLTTTYTFIPTSNQCATTAIMTIIVNPNTIPTFTQVAAICSGSTLQALPTISNNGIIGTWAPAINNTTTTVYTFIPASGQCATPATMTIVVTPKETPTFTQVATICSGSTLSALPTTSNNGITGTWSPAINNTSTTTYTFIPTVGQCASTVQMTIVILIGNATHTSNSYSNSSFGSYSINDPVQFTNLSIPGFINIKWDFGDGTFTNEENPLHIFIREGSYEIIQTVTYPFGCVYKNYITLIIDKGYKLIMPTGFTPNENVQNDYFAPEFLGLKAIQFDVYDTWGELIYSEYGDRIIGWDGKIKGKEAENGNYYFNLSAKTFYGTTINLQNPFVLIK